MCFHVSHRAAKSWRAARRFFVQQVAEFDPKASAPVRSAAPLLSSAIRDLGVITADLVASFPKLEACRASLLEQGVGERNSTWANAAALVATSKTSAGSSADDSAIEVRIRWVWRQPIPCRVWTAVWTLGDPEWIAH